jgi:pimeloyl-ACP methyl ester carboxylesterase
MIIRSDYRIPSLVEGVEMLLRNKHLNDEDQRLPGKTVLFVHGATYGSTYTFDYPVEGESWMDRMAVEGFDVWCLDMPGYGESDRPPEMCVPPEENLPIVDTEHAVSEVWQVVKFIRQHRGLECIDIIGYSWGSVICGDFAGRYPDLVNRLVLYGALWVEQGVSPRTIASKPGAYRTVDVASVMKRWGTGLTEQAFEAIVPGERVRQWSQAVVRCDPEFETLGVLRAPMGVTKDFYHCAETGEPWYKPEKIEAPALIVVGEQDRETTPDQGLSVFSRLGNARQKRYTVIGQGTHSLLLENNRHLLQSTVSGFLKES